MSYSSEPSVLILMGTFNGEKYIRDQLDSIAAQSHENWRLVISDDGSTDRTLEIARQWALGVGGNRVEFRCGPGEGFAQNFLSMATDSNLKADFYAFCDQDDVWMPNKLEVSLSHLNSVELATKPALYCGRTQYVDDELKNLGCSSLFFKPPSFKNALVQCLAGGNTMVFNHHLKTSLEAVGWVPAASHDWWLYQLTSGMGGNVIYDQNFYVLYRQHPRALVGENFSIASRVRRLRMGCVGDLKRYLNCAVSCLEKADVLLDATAKATLKEFSRLRVRGPLARAVGLRRLGIYRQTRLGNLGLFLLALLKKI